MSKKRGLSLEEKRRRLLDLIYEKKEFFQLKELERIAPKEKGITSQSVKEVLQSLVDDGLVDSDRIGTSQYFWAFPSKAANRRRCTISELTEKVADLKKKKLALEQLLHQAQAGREESDQRQGLLTTLSKRMVQRESMACDLDKQRDCDPQAMEELRTRIQVAVAATNRWTENIFTVRTWCRDRFGVPESEVDKQFGIPDDLDYL